MRLLFAVSAAGAISIIAQSVIARELLVLFSGSEFNLGLILGAWMLAGGAGSALAALLSGKQGRVRIGLVFSLGLLAWGFPVAIVFSRACRMLFGLMPGEALGMADTVYAVTAAVLPAGLAAGAIMTLAARLRESGPGREDNAGYIYAFDCIGAAVGGAALSLLLLPRFGALELSLLTCAALSLVASFLTRGLLRAFAVFFAVAALATLFPFGLCNRIDAGFKTLQWRPYRLLDSKDTAYGNLSLVDAGGERSLFSSGRPVASVPFPDEAGVEEFAHIPLSFAKPDPGSSVLVLGCGLGGLIRELRKHKGLAVINVDLDTGLEDMLRKTGDPLIIAEASDSEVEFRHEDTRSFLFHPSDHYRDLILLWLPPPETLESNRHYTAEFFLRLRLMLKPHGVAAIKLPGSLVYMDDAMKKTNKSVLEAMRRAFPHVRVIPGDSSNIFLCSKELRLEDISTEEVARNFQASNVETRLLTGKHIEYRLDREKEKRLLDTLEKISAPANRDFHPVAAFYALRHAHAMISPGMDGLLAALEKTPFPWLLSALLLVAALLAAARREKGLAEAVAASAGFSGMGLSIVLLFSYQIIFGALFRNLGLVMAIFMAGLGLGTLALSKAKTADYRRWVKALFIMEIFAALFVLALQSLEKSVESQIFSVQPIFLFLVLISGLVCGLEFAVSARLYFLAASGKRAGMIFAFDLCGAAVAAVLVSAWILPVYGLFRTCLLLASLKMLCAGLALREMLGSRNRKTRASQRLAV